MNAAHPLFHDILTRQRALPGQQTYRSLLGRRRTWLSANDAAAYDRGYSTFPSELPADMDGTPFATGWYDAEKERMDRQDREAEAALREISECDGLR